MRLLCFVARSIPRLAGCKTRLDSDHENNRILLAIVLLLRSDCAGSSSIRAKVAGGEHGLRSGVVFRVGGKPGPATVARVRMWAEVNVTPPTLC